MGEKLFEGFDGLIELLFGVEGGRKGLHQAEFFLQFIIVYLNNYFNDPFLIYYMAGLKFEFFPILTYFSFFFVRL